MRRSYRPAVLVTALLSALLVGSAAPASAGASGVVFGSLVATNQGETFEQAVARADSTYGRLPISRVFYAGAPKAWPDKAGYSGRPVVVSFKYAPAQVLTGQHDAALRRFFTGAPTGYDVYWSYLHEPEDNVQRGEFAASTYRAAWERISRIAAERANTRLRSTLILQCYTLNPASGRDWHDFYAGAAAQSMIAFDCYNHAGKKGGYGDPAKIFKPILDWQQTPEGSRIPWGIAEVGSTLSPQDPSGTQRAAWLRSVASFLAGQHAADPKRAVFGIYFDSAGGGKGTDYRLLDGPSQTAWRDVVSSY